MTIISNNTTIPFINENSTCPEVYPFVAISSLIGSLVTIILQRPIIAIWKKFQTKPSSHNFEKLQFDLEKFKIQTEISNSNLLSSYCQPIAKEGLCSYLKKMDVEEYEEIKKEHKLLLESNVSLKKSIQVGIIATISVLASGVLFYLPIFFTSPIVFSMSKKMIVITCIITTLFTITVSKMQSDINRKKLLEETIKPNRKSRLTSKVHKLEKRISNIEKQKKFSKEIIQLKIARDYFNEHLKKTSKTS